MNRLFLFTLVLFIAGSTIVFRFSAQAAVPTQYAEGSIAGHIWLDANCDGIKDIGEGNVANAGVVQLINTGGDRILTPGDRAITYSTDSQGNWKGVGLPVNGYDNLPVIWAIAVGKGSSALLGYTPSPPGGNSILSGPPSYASPTFQVQDGVTKQMGEIGLCALPKVYLPSVQK